MSKNSALFTLLLVYSVANQKAAMPDKDPFNLNPVKEEQSNVWVRCEGFQHFSFIALSVWVIWVYWTE